MLGVCAYVESARIPFDIPKAEPEIIDGYLIEYSGRKLGLMIYSLLIKQFALLSLIVALALPHARLPLALSFIVWLFEILCLTVLFTVVEVCWARYKINIGIKCLSILICFSALSLILAILGV